MENQMKICFVTMEQFNLAWGKSMPQQRFSAELTTLAFMAKHLNTLFVVGKKEDFLAEFEDVVPEKWLPQSIPLAPEIKELNVGDRLDTSSGIARLVRE